VGTRSTNRTLAGALKLLQFAFASLLFVPKPALRLTALDRWIRAIHAAKLTAITSFLLTFGAFAGRAQTLTCTFQFVGSGTIGTRSFTNASITITTVGSREDGYSSEYFAYIRNTAATIVISGIGPNQFLASTETSVGVFGLPIMSTVASYETFSFSVGNATLIDAYGTAGLWVMGSSVGPLSLAGSFQNWNVSPVITTDGYTLTLNDGPTELTFQAALPCPGIPSGNVADVQSVINQALGAVPPTAPTGIAVDVVSVQFAVNAALGCTISGTNGIRRVR
jgi:hypothetical protein